MLVRLLLRRSLLLQRVPLALRISSASRLHCCPVATTFLPSRPAAQMFATTTMPRSVASQKPSADRLQTLLQRVEHPATRMALQQDAERVLCKTCGMQYDEDDAAKLEPPEKCPVCEDERQYVPAEGQQWTCIAAWIEDALDGKITSKLVPEPGEPRVLRVITDGISVGIGQTPMVIITKHGFVIWDCSAAFLPSIIAQLVALRKEHGNLPLLCIAISHPHFYTTALTWAKALDTKVVVSAKDRQWFMRANDGERVHFFNEEQYSVAPGLRVIRCGGHFDGSCVLHWDRQEAPGPQESSFDNGGVPLATSGAVFCADTFAPNSDRHSITFMYSYPNLIPLPPKDVLQIWHAMRPFAFEDIIGGWPGRSMHGQARERLLWSAKRFVRMEGHDDKSFEWGE